MNVKKQNRHNRKRRPKSAGSNSPEQGKKVTKGNQDGDQRRRRRRRPHSKNRDANNNNQNQKSDGQQRSGQRQGERASGGRNQSQRKSHQGQRRGNNRNRNRNNRNRSNQPRVRTDRGTISLYMDQVNQYIKARKEYFNYFRGVFNHRLHKLAQNYKQALTKLRQYEQRMEPEKKQELEPFTNFFPEDNEFSTNHPEQELPGTGDDNELPAIFYHELTSQKEAFSYAEDTEESSGSLEDYQKYKDQILIN